MQKENNHSSEVEEGFLLCLIISITTQLTNNKKMKINKTVMSLRAHLLVNGRDNSI